MTPLAADVSAPAKWLSWTRFTLIGVTVGLALFVAGALIAAQLAGFGATSSARNPAHWPNLALFAQEPVVVKAHLIAALGAIVLGAVMMLSRKGRRFHRIAGWTWTGLLAFVAATSLFIDGLSNGRWSALHLTAGWVLLILSLAVWAARRHRPRAHGGLMMWLFFGALLITGAFAFLPGRLLWRMVLG
jgi:uncharacterized membrane protein